jgi:hypothetical protein
VICIRCMVNVLKGRQGASGQGQGHDRTGGGRTPLGCKMCITGGVVICIRCMVNVLKGRQGASSQGQGHDRTGGGRTPQGCKM